MKNILLVFSAAIIMMTSCQSKPTAPPVNLNKHAQVKVAYEERDGLKVIPVKLNGVSMDMIYDSGCTGVHLSLLELQQLVKQGCFSEEDILGTTLSTIADGSIVENGKILLHSIEIGPDLVLEDVEATVSLNHEAPLLLGNSVLDELATNIEVDNVAKEIIFTKR